MSLLVFDEVKSESGKFDLKLQSTRQTNGDSSVYFWSSLGTRAARLNELLDQYPQITQITQTKDEEADALTRAGRGTPCLSAPAALS